MLTADEVGNLVGHGKALQMAMLVVTGVLHRKSNLTVVMMTPRPHPDSSMLVVVMLLLLLVLLGMLRPLPLSAAGQQHKVVRVAGVLTQVHDNEPWLLSSYRCTILLVKL